MSSISRINLRKRRNKATYWSLLLIKINSPNNYNSNSNKYTPNNNPNTKIVITSITRFITVILNRKSLVF